MKSVFRDSKLYVFFLAILLIGLQISALYRPAKKQSISNPKQEVWINVFVHGIMSIKPHVSWNNFMLFVKDEIEDTLYEKTVALMREDQFFHKNQAMHSTQQTNLKKPLQLQQI